MDYRKIIKFGENSFVISLPNKWVKDNKLKKGDLVNVENEESVLQVSPHLAKKEKELVSEVSIDLDKIKTMKHLRTHLTAAYINGYDQIMIIGKDLAKENQKIRELTKNFIALEIIEQTNQRIVLREFVDLQEASVPEVLRRMDRIIISMAEDAENHLLGNGDYIEILKQKDTDISRLYHFIFRAIKSSLRPENRAVNKMSTDDTLYYWSMNSNLERVANQLKRIPRYSPRKINPKVISSFRKLADFYNETMKAVYTKNAHQSIALINKRKELFEEAEKASEYLPKDSRLMVEKMKNAIDATSLVSKTFLRHYYA